MSMGWNRPGGTGRRKAVAALAGLVLCGLVLSGAGSAPDTAALAAECRAGHDVYEKPAELDVDNLIAQHDRAVAACNRLIDSGAVQGEALALVLLDRADLTGAGDPGYAQALLDYDRAIALLPDPADAHWRRSKASLLYARDLPMALRDVERAIALDPQRPEYYVTRASVLGFSGQPERSMADLETALRLDPQWVNALVNRGLAHFSNGDLDKAAKDFDAAIALAPEDGSIYSLRGALRAAAGDTEGAEEDNQMAQKLLPFGMAY